MAPNPSVQTSTTARDPDNYKFENGHPVIDGVRCDKTIITKDDKGEEVSWTNCCDPTDIKSCTKEIKLFGCPTGYSSCADANIHPSMCSADLSGYERTTVINKKCCPPGYFCGLTFDAPCQKIDGDIAAQPLQLQQTFTLPLYASAPGVYDGCDKGHINPDAAGGIIAAGVLVFLLATAAVLWLVRRRLYRDPRQIARRENLSKMIDEHLGLARHSSNTASSFYKKPAFFPEPPRKMSASLKRTESRLYNHGSGNFSRPIKIVPHGLRVYPNSKSEKSNDGITVTREVQIQTIEEVHDADAIKRCSTSSDESSNSSEISPVPAKRGDGSPEGESWLYLQEKQMKRSQMFDNQRI